ncbi:MAG: alpha/beta fold hydrolase [Steroidobacteraceae bacterium]
MNRRKKWLAALFCTALTLTLLGRIAWNSYRSALADFAPNPESSILLHSEQVGIAGLEEVSFINNALKVRGWYVPSTNRAAVIVTHGTNADRSSMLAEIRLLAAAGFGVLAFDWPGTGQSQGAIKWGVNEQQALREALDWLSQRPDVDVEKIGALGFSCGGIIVAQVAAVDTRLRAVVLEATPTSFKDYVLWDHRRWGWLSEKPAEWALRTAGLRLDLPAPSQVIKKVAPRPVLLIAGDQDEVVPTAMVRDLFDATGEPKQLWIASGARHGLYAEAQPAEYGRVLRQFYTDSLLSRLD